MGTHDQKELFVAPDTTKEREDEERDASLLSYVENGSVTHDPIISKPKIRHTFGKTRSLRVALRTLCGWPEPSSKPLRSTAWLDGLRGVAALEVLLYHWHLYFLGVGYNPAWGSQEDTKQWWRLPFIRNYYHSGHAMVNVFFTISGFVLTHRSLMLIRSSQRGKVYDSLSSAVFRRAIRIFLPTIPITFFGMILIYTRIKVDDHIEVQSSIFAQVADWFSVTMNYINPFHDYANQWDILNKYEYVMWTLPLEFYGSIVCYVVMLGCARVTSYWKRNVIVLTVMYFAFVKGNWWSFNFLAGTLLADYTLHQDAQKSSNKIMQTRAIRLFWLVILIWSFYLCGLPDAKPEEYNLPGFDWYYAHVPASQAFIEGGGRFWWMVAGISLTVSISQLSEARAIFETTFCQYLGKISFMLYLVHTYTYLIIGSHWKGFLSTLLGHKVYSKEFEAELFLLSTFGEYLVYIFFWLVMLPVVFIVSACVTRFIDEPAIKFAKSLELSFIENIELPR